MLEDSSVEPHSSLKSSRNTLASQPLRCLTSSHTWIILLNVLKQLPSNPYTPILNTAALANPLVTFQILLKV